MGKLHRNKFRPDLFLRSRDFLGVRTSQFRKIVAIDAKSTLKVLSFRCFCLSLYTFSNFMPMSAREEAAGREPIYRKRRYLWRFVLDVQESGSSNNQSRIKATMTSIRYVVFVPFAMFTIKGFIAWGAFIYISAWASALLVQTDWAMPEPLYVGRAAGWTPTSSFCISANNFVDYPWMGGTWHNV